ncbi:DUF4240 domain-containing protein [Streptacidiphilus sp. PB12-B1b]|uniref:DUF4240 domain-containing protein n=1 Tax=Streptacidiphilus sp. PB12-B1b TaxID=2705012 RepID=UPI0015FBA912|nr:DUF4240 domain-containing protein [Streptacidiphilus sp. PB12-B1b]QMU77784.1 DUF4240 domain-containing protein [Streptacidiphilus sp. PB12-B1b]
MDTGTFWELIDTARAEVADPADGHAVAARASALLGELPAADIVAAQQLLWDALTRSYRSPLWAAAYTLNGGCSDDGFDYFRGWLVLQGRAVFERAVADPDSLSELPAVMTAAQHGHELECEAALAIAWNAHLAATGAHIPRGSCAVRYPALDPAWGFDFDDAAEMSRRLPRIAALCRVS